ncbi:MAG: hypothetical protein RLZZ419_1838 [Pseudomonadota bacterium]
MKFGVDGVMTCRLVFAWGGIVAAAVLLSGCARDSKPVQFYRLNANSAVVSVPSMVAATQGLVVGLGPIRIPEYLNRPQMIMAITDNQYQLSEDHRWAERLDQNISLALFKVLPRQLGTDRIVRYPWPQRQVVDYQVGIDILEFNVDARGQSPILLP